VFGLVVFGVINVWLANALAIEPAKLVEPRDEIIRPFNGKDLTGFTAWLRTADRTEDENNYSVESGMIRISGEGMGYLGTVDACYNVFPAGGRILLENEKNEIYFRNFEIRPLSRRKDR